MAAPLSSLLDTASVLVERLTYRVSVEAGPQLCRAAVSVVTLTWGMAGTFSLSSYSRRSGDRRRGPSYTNYRIWCYHL